MDSIHDVTWSTFDEHKSQNPRAGKCRHDCRSGRDIAFVRDAVVGKLKDEGFFVAVLQCVSLCTVHELCTIPLHAPPKDRGHLEQAGGSARGHVWGPHGRVSHSSGSGRCVQVSSLITDFQRPGQHGVAPVFIIIILLLLLVEKSSCKRESVQ